MADNKDPEPKVDFSDTKALDAKRSSRKTKIVVIGVLALVLLLGAVVSVTSFFILRKPTSTRLAEVNLEEGETLTYRVDQNIELEGGNAQKGTIRAIVGIRVLNKTSEEYWFLMKFNLSHVDGNMDIKSMRTIEEHFLVRLQIATRTPNHENKETAESFQIYGRRHTDEELVRHIYGILDQLLPTLKRDLYEDVDGVKVSDSHALNPEDSPLLPGSVKMHREANTSYKDAILIKNHFDRADFLNMSSDIDLDLKYSDYAFINKSNGMVTESHSYFSEQLNFGEQIHFKGGVDASMMKITLTSHVSLLKTHSIYFGYSESKAVNYHFFVRLVVPKATPTFSVNRQPQRSPSASNNSPMPLNGSLPSQQHNSSNSSVTPLKRSRRASNFIRQIWDEADPIYLRVEHSYTVFEKSVIGINVKGKATIWLEDSSGLEVGVKFNLIIGGNDLGNILYKKYRRDELEDGQGTRTGLVWSHSVTIYIPVFILSVGVDFSLNVKVNNELSFPPESNSISPFKLAIQIEPFGEVTGRLSAYVSAYIIRAGVSGDGTLVRIGLPVTLSYQADRSPGRKWCVSLSTRLTALELSARVFYQWRSWWLGWGSEHTLYHFGTWAAVRSNWQVLSRCG